MKAAEEESNEEEGGEIKQLHCETAYIQKVISETYGRSKKKKHTKGNLEVISETYKSVGSFSNLTIDKRLRRS